MPYRNILFSLAGTLLLGGCDAPSQQEGHVFEYQEQALERAGQTEQQILDAAAEQQRQIEAETR